MHWHRNSTINNGDGTLRSNVTVAQSANSLSKTTTVDVNGDGEWEAAMNGNRRRSICLAA